MGRKAAPSVYIALVAFLLFWYHVPALKASYYLQAANESATIAEWARNASSALDVRVPFGAEVGVFLAEELNKREKAGVPLAAPEVVRTVERLAAMLAETAEHLPVHVAHTAWAGQLMIVLGEHGDDERFDDAIHLMQHALALSPKKQELLFLLSKAHLLRKEFDKAIEANQQAVTAAPEIGVSHWFLGLAYVASGELETGLAEIEQSIELGRALSRKETLYVIDLYAEQKKYDIVVQQYQQLVEDEPENIAWYVKLAAAYALAGRTQEALDLAREIAVQAPELREALEAFIREQGLE